MKLALYSDLHLRLTWEGYWKPPRLSVDVVILAGDICDFTDGIEWARRRFEHQRIIYVSGNHEFYGGSLRDLDAMREHALRFEVDYLEDDVVTIDGVRFLGATLWSGFTLYGEGEAQLLAMQAAQSRIRDYHAIVGALDGQRLSPYETLHRHHQSVAWLDRELATPHDGPTVVVTHFAPHRRCVAPEYENSPVTPYFVSDLAWLMEKRRIALWCHGHTHTNVDFVAEGGCRVLSNQRGYQREVEWGGMKFRPRLKIQL